MKKLLSIILSIVMLLSVTAGLSFNAYADTGTDGITYGFNSSTGLLVLTNTSGTGEMNNYLMDAPWLDYADKIKSVTIRSGITSIGSYAFYGCENLTTVTFEGTATLTKIVDGAFSGCTSLSSITIPATVTSISNTAFYGCSGLTSITIPDSVTSIGERAFSECTSLQKATIGAGLKTIDNYVFEYCEGLQIVTIGKGVSTIKDTAFIGCTSLSTINVDSSNSYYSSSWDGVLFNKGKTTLVRYPVAKAASYTIPDTVKSISVNAFESCSKLTSITIPDTVTYIGAGAFFNCTGLTSATISNSVTAIYGSTFGSCTSLKSITIPDSVKTIDSSAFSNCTSLESITLGSSLVSVGDHAFDGCTSLKDVYYPGTEDMWKQIDIDICNDALTNATIHWHVHSYNSSEVTKPATCVENGIMTITCTGCGDTQTVVIPSAHTPEVIPAVPASCIATGLTAGSKCSVCGEILTAQTTVPMIAHTPMVVPAVPATTESTGLTEGSKCAVCSAILVAQQVVDKLPAVKKVSVPKITLKTVKSKKSKQITVSWKKNTKVTGYEVQYSTDKKFKKSVKKATIKKNKTTSTTLKKLKGKKKYYVRIRAYKTVNGKKYYSSWSKAMTVTTKK